MASKHFQVHAEQHSFEMWNSEFNIGWKGLQLGLTVKAGPHRHDETGKITQHQEKDGQHQLVVEYPCGLQEKVVISEQAHGYALKRRIHNPGIASIAVAKPFVCAENEQAGPKMEQDLLMNGRYAHLDNLRSEDYPKCRAEYPFLRPMPWQAQEFGNQESQAAPYMLFTSSRQRTFLMEAQMDQLVSRCTWELGVNNTGMALETYRLNWSFNGAGGFTLHADQEQELETVHYSIFTEQNLEECIRIYSQQVVESQNWQGRKNPLAHTSMYCSWNYGIERNIDHDSLANRAQFISKNLPHISHFLIDGGWVPWEMGKGPHLGNFNLADDEVYDHSKFPHGMRGISDAIVEAGLKPAIHWTPFVRLNTKLAQEHQDWLCRDSTGDIYRISDYGYFDYSIPEVREFFHHVFKTIFHTYGFQGMKMDFWSQSVESNHIRYRHGGTGIHWRNWLLSTIESYLPEDGFLMTCVAVAMGNPFLGKHAQTYRCGFDVGYSSWDDHIRSSIWSQPLYSSDERNMALLNLDGFGVSEVMTDDENLHRLTYGFITMGSFEIDGKLEERSPKELDWLNRLSAHPDRGHAVTTIDDQVYTGVPLPKCMKVDYPEDSLTYQRGVRQHIALFNWNDDEQTLAFSAEQLGLPENAKLRHFWSDEVITLGEMGLVERLRAHASALYEVVESV